MREGKKKRADEGGQRGNIDLVCCRIKAEGNVGVCRKCHETSSVPFCASGQQSVFSPIDQLSTALYLHNPNHSLIDFFSEQLGFLLSFCSIFIVCFLSDISIQPWLKSCILVIKNEPMIINWISVSNSSLCLKCSFHWYSRHFRAREISVIINQTTVGRRMNQSPVRPSVTD